MRWAIFFLFLLVCANLALAIRVNEVMYNPSTEQGSDTNLEWIELYNENGEVVDLSNWTIDGNNFDDVNISAGSYLVVARNLASFQSYYGNSILAVDGSFILSNDGDTIDLSDGTENWQYNYDSSHANGNGKTLEWSGSSWQESFVLGGTPGRENSVAGFSQNYGALQISEFLPDPIGGDDAAKPWGEWIEIYNPTETPMDLDGLVFYDKDDDHELYIVDTTTTSGTIIQAGSYLVIYRNEDSDFALNNDGYEEVRLADGYPINSSNLIDSVSYSGSVEGMSWSKIEGGWYKSLATPGSENARVNGCDWEIKVLPWEPIVGLGEEINFDVVVKRNYGEPAIVTVNGTIEDFFGKTVKTYVPWTDEDITTSRTKVYTPNLGDDVYKISFRITELDCQDNDLSNNIDSKVIVVNPKYKIFDSSLEIEEIYLGNDDEAEWGDRIRVKVNIYKGDETKYSVQLYAEKDGEIISKRTKTSVFDKFTNYTLTLPVQLEPNCDGYYRDGKYDLVLEGLDKEDKVDFRIEGKDKELCKVIDGSTSKGSGKFEYKILEYPEKIKPDEGFKVKVELNGDDQEHNLRLWGYVYKGPKHYSDEKVEEIKLGMDEIKIVDLTIRMDEGVESGDYKLKIKLNKDNQKTDKEMTEEIFVEEEEKECVIVGESLAEKSEVGLSEKLKLLRELNEDGKIVYLSSSKGIVGWLPAMIVGVLVMLSLILIFKKV
ncbi:lamin tail domain-containing protein [Candidatus Woesearchaeota archaeon]|nr:lamin tail domain-containing protein [Candidatus Woesearchaeota archaeon]